MIQAINITKQYKIDKITIDSLNGVDIEINKGDFVAIEGPSGSGKSTLLHILGCIESPTSGRVIINGTDTSSLSSKALARLRLTQIGFVFQQFYLLPTLSAYENIELPMGEAGLSKKKKRERTKYLLESVGLDKRSQHKPTQLSGGEQQRVAIARSLANEPSIILADEPTGELDSDNSTRIMDLFQTINREFGQTVVMVSHDMSITSRAQRLIHLKDGRIIV
ncbi:MAG: ABC transporter ATP-binding protein [Methanosarcinales archaeon]|nr:ABC transporter ATP-binding protein [Methanosarcinales archaeon]